MADLKKNSASWNREMRRMGLWIGEWFRLRDEERRLRKSRYQIREYLEQGNKLSSWDLNGVNVGSNTADNGKLWGKLTDEVPASNYAQLILYSDSGRTASVCGASGADSTTFSLSALNSSGLSGSVAVGAVAASDVDFYLQIAPDIRSRVSLLFTREEDVEILPAIFDQIDRRRAAIASQMTAWKSRFDTEFVNKHLKRFLESTESTAGTSTESVTSGVVSRSDAGALADLVDAMGDDTCGVQTFLENTTTGSGPSKDPDNTGSGIWSSISRTNGIYPGVVTFECNDATLGAETFAVKMVRDDDGGIVTAQNNLTIKKAWLSVDVGMGATLNRSISVAGGNTVTVGTVVINGESASNTDAGDLYWEVLRSGSDYTINLYNASTPMSATSTTLKAQGSVTGSAGYNGSISFTEANNSGLSGSANISGYSSDDDDVSNVICLNPFALKDKFRSTVTNTESGWFSTFLGRQYKLDISAITSGTNTVQDAYAMPFPRIGSD